MRRNRSLSPASTIRTDIRKKRFVLPSWWMAIAPGKSASFWISVEGLRKEAGIRREDRDGMAYLIRRAVRN